MTNDKQKTFGEIVGMEAEVPVGKHCTDTVTCSDGTVMLESDAFEDCEGNYHSDAEDRHEREVTIVTEFLDGVDKWVTEYAQENEDWTSSYDHIVFEVLHDGNRSVEEWVRENSDHGRWNATCRYNDDTVKRITKLVCENLDYTSACEAEFNHDEYADYPGPGCCLWGTDIGEQEKQIEVNNHECLSALHACDRLDDVLDDVYCDVYVRRSKNRVKNEKTGCYEEVGRKTYKSGRTPDKLPTFYTSHTVSGRWDWVVSADRMNELVTEAIIEICRKG